MVILLRKSRESLLLCVCFYICYTENDQLHSDKYVGFLDDYWIIRGTMWIRNWDRSPRGRNEFSKPSCNLALEELGVDDPAGLPFCVELLEGL